MQQNQRRILYILLLVAGLAWTGTSADRAGQSSSQGIAAPQVGFLAPDFELTSLDGASYTLSASRGRPVIINLWAAWCPPCRAEMPALQQMHEEYKGRGLIILAVNATTQDDPHEIPAFIKQYGLTFPILLDETGEVSRAYQLRSLPSSYFIGRDGRVKEVVIGGPMAPALLRTRIEEILR